MWMTVLYGASFLLIDALSMKNVNLIVLKCALYSIQLNHSLAKAVSIAT